MLKKSLDSKTIIVINCNCYLLNKKIQNKKGFSELNNRFKKKTLFYSPWYSEYTFEKSSMCMQDIFMFHLHMTLQSSSHPCILPTTDLEFLFPRLFHCQSSLHSSIFSSGREISLYARARSWYEFIHPFSRYFSTSCLSAMLDVGGVISGDAPPPTHSCLKLC